MNDRLTAAVTGAEPQTRAALQAHGYAVQDYGQGMLTPAAREMLRGIPTPQRWTPDFLVARAAVVDAPRWPRERTGKYAFLVDAKFRWDETGNQSVEMRSALAAPTFGLDVFYVCSCRGPYGKYSDFTVIHHSQVLSSRRYHPCCASCDHILTKSPDPMRELPEYCPNQSRGRKSSGTPFVYFPVSDCLPLSAFVFDNLAMGRLR